MGFATALSGLKAASTNLQVTGNNIANSQTVGFKESRAEFADVYASSIGGVSKTQPGAGVRVTEVAQQFNQGNIESTQNSLDLAVSGNGFFVLSEAPSATAVPTAIVAPTVPTAYTRNGSFQLDSAGNVVNTEGKSLLVFAPNGTTAAQGFSVGVFTPLQINTSQGLPTTTTKVAIKLNLNAGASVPANAVFDPTDPNSYNNTTSVTTYDSQGNPHIASTYYVKDVAVANKWNAYLFLDNFGITATDTVPVTLPTPAATVSAAANLPGASIPLTFSATGALETVNGSAVPVPPAVATTNLNTGSIDLSLINTSLLVSPMAFGLDFGGTTQYATPFSVNGLSQDGLPAGNLTGIDVDGTGAVFARYSNGGSKVLGQVALARFPSSQALAKLGNTDWATTSSSGQPIFGAAGSNNFGSMQSSALEGSNVDISAQLVKLIVAQQAYQANSQSITTEKTLIETILRA
jgi:flagellar hook protein FlgE